MISQRLECCLGAVHGASIVPDSCDEWKCVQCVVFSIFCNPPVLYQIASIASPSSAFCCPTIQYATRICLSEESGYVSVCAVVENEVASAARVFTNLTSLLSASE